jgi:tRNA U34 5-carboxymethylaminomethyl modifying GTPase MnmE/TrmE
MIVKIDYKGDIMDSDKLCALLDDLKQLRDEAVVKANLGKKEVEEEIEKLEPLYEDLKVKMEKFVDIAGDTASELKAAAELGIDAKSVDDLEETLDLASEELKKAYHKIKEIV